MPALPKMSSAPAYTTRLGAAHCGDSMDLLDRLPASSINLVVTSPPFALLREKTYGNKAQEHYVDWLLGFAEKVKRVLKDDGSFVIDMGGAYERGSPSRSIYQFRFLVRAVDEIGLTLAEDVYWNNPAKLPSPIEWVNKRKLRMKDSVNNIWWFSKNEWPKADITKVLAPYSDRMKKLLEDPDAFYTPKKRPSGHDIGKGFATDNGGAIPSNLISVPNTESNGFYSSCCKLVGTPAHPARFPVLIPQHFIRMCTDPGDVVLDIFAGSNTTGQVAEAEDRSWLAFEQSAEYVAASAFRFLTKANPVTDIKGLYALLAGGETGIDMTNFTMQPGLLDLAAAE
jgi:site-specific DNA-methyltransferase (cytosine-N4-specific)